MTSLKLYDIVIIDLGHQSGSDSSVQQGLRPALILQNDKQNAASTTTIAAPITSCLKKTSMFSHILLGKRFGLRTESMLLLEQLRTVDQSSVIKVIGHITDESVITSINQGILKTLGIHARVLNTSMSEDIARCQHGE